MAVKARIMGQLKGRKLNEVAAQGQKQSSGVIEEAGKTTREMVRTLLSCVEEGIGTSVPTDSKVMSWMVRWAAMLENQANIGSDARTPYGRLKGKQCSTDTVVFRESVFYAPREDKEPEKETGNLNGRRDLLWAQWKEQPALDSNRAWHGGILYNEGEA